ncbi:uncharacterized protein PFL1_06236 [Pseudozyma flocculosa PF-1]|uniref:Related to TRP4 - anthranilate phosphoribosyltransferase n=2 Tax=Pseudozyma flocculosa TaxID=84751 RepID=A0A5C3FA35_9BASI|nr:uncharacterized protein PFL1_06236 [Pseudozyma flocculosa PF-1]EPQ26301.1 hypothetical protein PFL1_06236 [Pseudozyma flocculosa PF-1]SPO40261.1 related to TRP4 - anthranilate phosphoribosyltransferase [Pseudozyma flocculosa]
MADTVPFEANPNHPQHTADTFRPILKALALAAAVDPRDPFNTPPASYRSPSHNGAPPPQPILSQHHLETLFEHLADPNFTSSRENHAQIGSALTSLKFTRLDIQADTFALAARIFLDSCLKVHVDPLDASLRPDPPAAAAAPGQPADVYEGTLDLVGTGGDGKDTFNVSTTAAMVAAGVPGVRVCKHGAKASSSTSGSADLLISLGIPLLTLPPSQIAQLLPRTKFAFLFAQLYHPALAPLGPIRRNLGFPTIFNVLGPLINPAQPERCILGVHSYYLGRTFAEALRKRGTKRAWIVCGREGLDEISPEGPTDVWELNDGEITEFSITPSSFGLASHALADVGSHSAHENASIVLHLFSSSSLSSLPTSPLPAPLHVDVERFTDRHTRNLVSHLPPIPAGVRLGAIADYTLLQSAALLYVGSYAPSLPAATDMARKSMQDGAALRALERFRTEAIQAVQRDEEIKKREEDEAQKRGRRSSKDLSADSALARKQDQYSYLPETYQDVAVGTDDA